MTSDRVVSDLMLPLWEEVLWLFLDAWDQCASAHNLCEGALFLPSGEGADGPQG